MPSKVIAQNFGESTFPSDRVKQANSPQTFTSSSEYCLSLLIILGTFQDVMYSYFTQDVEYRIRNNEYRRAPKLHDSKFLVQYSFILSNPVKLAIMPLRWLNCYEQSFPGDLSRYLRFLMETKFDHSCSPPRSESRTSLD